MLFHVPWRCCKKQVCTSHNLAPKCSMAPWCPSHNIETPWPSMLGPPQWYPALLNSSLLPRCTLVFYLPSIIIWFFHISNLQSSIPRPQIVSILWGVLQLGTFKTVYPQVPACCSSLDYILITCNIFELLEAGQLMLSCKANLKNECFPFRWSLTLSP